MRSFFVSALVAGFALTGLLHGTVSAQLIPNTNCQGAAANSAVCQENNTTNDPVTGADGLILKVANIITVLAGAAAVIVIVLGGLRLIRSGGNSEAVASGRRAIIYSLVGIVVILISRILVGLILSLG